MPAGTDCVSTRRWLRLQILIHLLIQLVHSHAASIDTPAAAAAAYLLVLKVYLSARRRLRLQILIHLLIQLVQILIHLLIQLVHSQAAATAPADTKVPLPIH